MTLAQALLNVGARIPVSDPQVKKRLDRAYDICISGGYTITKSIGVGGSYKYHVHKASTAAIATGEDSSAMYTVDSDGCTCPDALTARAGLCKHRLATMLQREMETL